MIELGNASEAEMVVAFLQAEIDSHPSRPWAGLITSQLARAGLGRNLIDTPDLNNAGTNAVRRALLGYRGYPGAALFQGFPVVTWHRVQLEQHDFDRMRYANEAATLLPLSGPSRLVSDAARNYTAGSPAAAGMRHVSGIVAALSNGATFPPLIAAQDHDGSLILIEGHSRATAYVIAGAMTNRPALVARAASFAGWDYY